MTNLSNIMPPSSNLSTKTDRVEKNGYIFEYGNDTTNESKSSIRIK